MNLGFPSSSATNVRCDPGLQFSLLRNGIIMATSQGCSEESVR